MVVYVSLYWLNTHAQNVDTQDWALAISILFPFFFKHNNNDKRNNNDSRCKSKRERQRPFLFRSCLSLCIPSLSYVARKSKIRKLVPISKTILSDHNSIKREIVHSLEIKYARYLLDISIFILI